jgi:hypothetical protein
LKTSLQSTTHSYLRIRHLSHLTKLSQSSIPITPTSGDLLPSWGNGILCLLPSFTAPVDPLVLFNEIQVNLKEYEVLSIPLSSFSSSEEEGQIFIIPPNAPLTKTILSQFFLPQMTKNKIQECSSKFLNLCHLFTKRSQHTPSFLQGITLSTPWKMLMSVTDEMGILSQMNC